ncbi:MAG TPA: GntR family transcriptional regulator [Candidatus Scatomonas merdavium]|nr:GntR family transcriptional regulator [Candidatus Scatomonas merdavium]
MKDDDLSKIMREYQYMPLRDVVFHTLRRGIMQGDLKPGERLMEIKLANRLGVSRTPIREAIRMLELEGLVVMIPRKGAQVAEITAKDLKEVLEVRIGLEELAVKFACQRITEEQLEGLHQASRRFERAVLAEDLTELAEADVEFHDLVYKATANDRLVQLLNNIREQMYRYRVEYLKDEEIRASLVQEHDELLERLRERDMEGAKRVTQKHIERQQDYILETILGTEKKSE